MGAGTAFGTRPVLCVPLKVGSSILTEQARIKTLRITESASLKSQGWQVASATVSLTGSETAKEKVNQDRGIEREQNNVSVFAVFDGHGEHGHLAASKVADTLCTKILPALADHLKDPKKDANILPVLVKIFAETDADLLTDEAFLYSGTTANVCVLCGKQLLCCGLGDSRSVLGTCANETGVYTVTHLTSDHKPDRLEEKLRINKQGGEVRQAGNLDSYRGPMRVFSSGQDFPGLAVSRSFGDGLAKRLGVSCVPEFSTLSLNEKEHVVLICSDGVWDQMTPDEAVKTAMMHAKDAEAGAAAEAICTEARRRWQRGQGGGHFGNIDDITCVAVMLNPHPQGNVGAGRHSSHGSG